MDAQTAAANLARLDQLEQTLEAFAENARQMAVITANFQDSSQDALNHKLHTLITGLQVGTAMYALYSPRFVHRSWTHKNTNWATSVCR